MRRGWPGAGGRGLGGDSSSRPSAPAQLRTGGVHTRCGLDEASDRLAGTCPSPRLTSALPVELLIEERGINSMWYSLMGNLLPLNQITHISQ